MWLFYFLFWHFLFRPNHLFQPVAFLVEANLYHLIPFLSRWDIDQFLVDIGEANFVMMTVIKNVSWNFSFTLLQCNLEVLY